MVSRETDILKGSRPSTTRVAEPSVFEVAGDDSLSGERSAKIANVRQVIFGPPETTMDHEQERERSPPVRETQLSKVLRSLAIPDTFVEARWRPLQNVAQAIPKARY